MNSGYTVDPAALQSSSPQYGDHAQRLADIYAELTSKLLAEGDCWGNDDAGRAFAGNYVGPAVNALESMRQHSDGLVTIAEGVYAWARNYISADEAAKDDLSVQLGYQ
jgi:uncharacterized protein YukE